MNFEHVAGKDKGKIRLFALSTCIWCKKTRELLSSMGVAFDYIYVDLLKGEERAEAVAEVKKYNPSLSFPTLVIGEKCIVGLKEKEIKELVVLADGSTCVCPSLLHPEMMLGSIEASGFADKLTEELGLAETADGRWMGGGEVQERGFRARGGDGHFIPSPGPSVFDNISQ